jgi:hypothetical protein
MHLNNEDDEQSYLEYWEFRGLKTPPNFTFMPAGEALQVIVWLLGFNHGRPTGGAAVFLQPCAQESEAVT